jgi:uncharacterized protein YqgC (DUF456 family)
LEIHDFLAGVLVLAGLVGIVVPVLPGLLLQIGAIAFWAFEESSFVGWVVLVLAIVLAIAASVIKFVFPGKRLKEAQVPGWLVLVAVSVAIVGLFVIPVVGAPIGFVLTIYLFERAVLQSIGIELSGGFLIAVVFFFGVFLT